MKLKLVGNILMVTSSIKKEDFVQAVSIDSDAGTLCNENGDIKFVMKFDSEKSEPRFQNFSCTFNQSNEEGFMQAAILLAPQPSKEKYNEVIVNALGMGLNQAILAEKEIAKHVNAVNKTMNDLLESIE